MSRIRKLKKAIFILLFALLSFLPFDNLNSVNGEEIPYPPVIISEVYPDPSTGNEYVEIYNMGNEAIDMNGFTIYDVSSPAYGNCSKESVLFRLQGEIAPQQWVLLPLTSARLNNEGDRIILKDKNASILDEVAYGVCGTITSKKGYTLGRKDETISGLSILSPTPGGKNYLLNVGEIVIEGKLEIGQLVSFSSSCDVPSNALSSISWNLNNEIVAQNTFNFYYKFEKDGHFNLVLSVLDIYGNSDNEEIEFDISEENNPPSFDYSNLIINEIFPSPADGKSEWIELYNGGSFDLPLKGVMIDDIENGGSSPFTINDDITLHAREFLLFSKEKTGITFNNSGDSVILKSPGNELIDKVDYPSIATEKSYAFFDGEWFITDTPTPGEPNIVNSEKEEIKKVTICEAKNMVGKDVVIEGVVTASTGDVGKEIAYIQDSSGGIRVNTKEKLTVGQIVSVSGTVNEAWGEFYIKASTLDILGSTNISPLVIDIGKISRDDIGQLIKIEGKICKIDGSSMWIGEDKGIKVYLSPSLGWKRPSWIKSGISIEVVGILSQWGYNSDGEPNLRILPRNVNDLKIVNTTESPTLPSTGGILPIYFGPFILLIALLTKIAIIVVCKKSNI